MNVVTRLIAPVLLGMGLVSTAAVAEEGMEDHDKEGMLVHDVWVRAVPPSSKMSAAYMVLHNNTADDDHLVSAESDVAKAVELHNVRKNEGMMEMYQVKSIGVAAGKSAELKPGSYHVMLIGLKKALKEGDKLDLTLNFMHAGAIKITAPVKEGGMMEHGHGMKH